MKDIKLIISVDEANLILDALGQQPFVKVFGLIQKIQQQASEQLNGESQQQPGMQALQQPQSDAPDKNIKS